MTLGVSFDEVQLPPGISQGAVGGARFSTTVLGLASGAEQRNVNWSKRRGAWDVSYGLRSQDQIEDLLDFFHARQGKAYGFRFKDWTDYRVPRWRVTPGDMGGFPVWFTTNGSTATFQMFKSYTSGGRTYTRNIQKPVAGSYALFNNAVAMSEGADYTLDTTTGIVTLSNAITATSTHQISGYSEFDVPARFDTDEMKVNILTTDNTGWGPIPVVEIRDIN